MINLDFLKNMFLKNFMKLHAFAVCFFGISNVM